MAHFLVIKFTSYKNIKDYSSIIKYFRTTFQNLKKNKTKKMYFMKIPVETCFDY